ncbi:MAG: DUF3750 domain-containing protein [Thermoanaerobaculaceae bacterium]|nr:DUF3750 domain-containing protein [Thermoanaerobaculaceae bacterium]
MEKEFFSKKIYWDNIKSKSLADTLYFYHSDHLGTPIAMTDTSGTFVWRAEHTPFGGIYALPVSTITNNLRFPRQYFDSETGLSQNWFRDYEARIGRYWEVDPVVVQSQSTPYAYSNLNPVQEIDFSGLQGSVSSPEAKQTALVCCRKAKVPGNPGFKHCYIQIGKTKYELQPGFPPIYGYTRKVTSGIEPGSDCETTSGCNLKDCVDKAFQNYPTKSAYSARSGPNSNTFVATIVKACKLKAPSCANNNQAPGWTAEAPK